MVAFKESFEQMALVDSDMATNISNTLCKLIQPNHNVFHKEKVSRDEVRIALLQEQLQIQAQASQYLAISDEIGEKLKNLWQFATSAPDIFFDLFYDSLEILFRQTRSVIYAELERDYNWYTTFADVAKKGAGGLANTFLKGANSMVKGVTGNRLTDSDTILDDKTVVETLISKHLDEEIIEREIGQLFEKASNAFKDAWLREISKQIPDTKRVSTFSMIKNASSGISVLFELGIAEQTLLTGMGAAVVGSFGLAMGWHTLAYAFVNVFPPIALVTAVATVVIGVVTKENSLQVRKKQIDEVIKQYHRYFLTQLYTEPRPELGNIPLRKYLEKTSSNIISDVLKDWEKVIFGELSTVHFRMLNSAFSKHLMFIQEALSELGQACEKESVLVDQEFGIS